MAAFSPEILKLPRQEINAAFLLKDNTSPLAKNRLRNWAEAKKDKELTAVWFCDDARLNASIALDTFSILPIRTIAAAGDSEPFKQVFRILT